MWNRATSLLCCGACLTGRSSGTRRMGHFRPPSWRNAFVTSIFLERRILPRCVPALSSRVLNQLCNRALAVAALSVTLTRSGYRPPIGGVLFAHVRGVAFVFEAVVINKLAVENQRLIDFHGPRGRIGLRIVDRDFDFERSVGRPPDLFGHFALLSQRVSGCIEPKIFP